MNLLEHQGKHLLASAGIRVPRGELVSTMDGAVDVARRLGGRAVCKAQIPAGKRGQSGAVHIVATPDEARDFAERLLGSDVSGYPVHELIVEEVISIDREFYAAVLDDPDSLGPLVLFSVAGGMDIEETNATRPELVHRLAIDIRKGLSESAARGLVAAAGLNDQASMAVAPVLVGLYQLYLSADANLVEINPLVLTSAGTVTALDAKITIDPGSVDRQEHLLAGLPGGAPPASGTELELRGQALDLQFIELDGDVGVLANGAGLTMTTLDAITHFGGRPANFLEIGGDAYTRATPALELVLSNPRVKSVLVNFCGAFARTDVMTEGVVKAVESLQPKVPIVFTIHGTGEDEAIALVRERLAVEPYDLMDDAVQASITAARRASEEATA